MFKLILILSIVGPVQSATAGMNLENNEKKTLIFIVDDCGYCSNHDYQAKSCTIDEDGKVEIIDHQIGQKETTKNRILSQNKLNELKKLISETQNEKLEGKIQIGSGDLPSFSITGNPETSKEYTIQHYSYGRELINTKEARILTRKSARICGMEQRRLLWKTVLSKIAP